MFLIFSSMLGDFLNDKIRKFKCFYYHLIFSTFELLGFFEVFPFNFSIIFFNITASMMCNCF